MKVGIGASDLKASRIDEASKVETETILKRCIKTPVSPGFMARPARWP